MKRIPSNTERFSLFEHLQQVWDRPKPLDPKIYRSLPIDLPSKDQTVIEQARNILEERESKRDRIWVQLTNHWGLKE